MPLQFLATGDLQVHKWQQFAKTTKSGMNSRLYNCLKVLDILRREALRRKIDKVLLNGDIFEEVSYVDVEAYDGVYIRLERLHSEGIEVVINLGNHDVFQQSGGRVLHALRAFRKVATIVEEPRYIFWNHLFVVPWMSSPDRIKMAIRSCKATKEHCLVLHCGVQGATTGPTGYLARNPIKLRDLRAKDFGLVLLSDYHTRQRLARNVIYMGSPLQHTFGEIHRPCIWRVCLRGGDRSPKLEKIFTSFPRFRRIRARSREELEKRCAGFQGDYVRISPRGNLTPEEIEAVAKRIGFQVHIWATGEDGESEQPAQSFQVQDVMKRYVKAHVKGRNRRAKLLALGEKIYGGT